MNFNYQEYTPVLQLQEFIECFWTSEVVLEGNKIVQEALVPGGRVEIIFSTAAFLWYGTNKKSKATSYSGSFLLGQRNSVSYAGFKEDSFLFGVRFRYGCAPLFAKGAANDYSNKIVPLNVELLDEISRLENADSANVRRIISQVETWLLDCIDQPTEDWLKLQMLVQDISAQNAENIVLGKLYEKHGWNYKKAERVFLKYLGFPPRTFVKLVRFRNALEKMKGMPDSSFTDAAHHLGFYDQSHFIREFHKYTGSSPSSFFKNPPEVAVLLYKLSRSK